MPGSRREPQPISGPVVDIYIFALGGVLVITRRKRSILELAVATACFGAAAVAAVIPATAHAAPQNTSVRSTAHQKKKAAKQVANANLLHEVVVNGFISSIQNAIAIQKNANSIVEAVSSEQIGKLPGTSIANALSSLPGLATQMVNGRPQVLTIHGLGPDFNTVQIDGVEQASTANNRDVQLDQYPASWFKTVEVHMTPSASLFGQGMAGTVDMITLKPLDQKGPTANINAYYTWLEPNQVMPGAGVSNAGHDINGIFSDQFLHHTLGVNFGIDLNATPSHILHQAPWGYPTTNGDYVIGGSKNYNISDLMKREGYLLTFEYRPSSAFTSTLNMTYDDFNETQQAKGVEFPLFWGGGTKLTVGNVTNGFVQSGTYNNVYPVIRNDYNHTKARVYNINWNNEFNLPDQWTAAVDASYNRATRQDIFLESYSGFGYNGPASNGAVPPMTVNFFEGSNGELFLTSPQNLSASSIVLTDPQGWGSGANLVQQGFINAPHTDDYLANLKVTAEHYFNRGPISSVQIGVDRRKRHKLYSISQDFLVLPGASCGDVISSTCTPTQTAPIPASALESTTTAALGFMGIGPQVLYNPLSVLATGADVMYPTSLSSIAVPPNWSVSENDTDAYLQFNLHANLTSEIGLRGNFGLQVDHTSQVSGGSRVAPGSTTGGSATTVLIPTLGGVSYTRYLPSLNLVFSLPDDNNFRLGVARTMARPRMDYTSSSLDISGNITQLSNSNPNQSYFSGSGGNPQLLPTMATNYNLSLEHYFTGRASGFNCNSSESKASSLCSTGGTGYVQLSGYYLQLSDYINPNAAVLYNFQPYVSAYLTPAQQAQLGTTYGTITAANNDGSGHIEGLQLATNIPLGDFTPYLNGFGILASANRTLSAVYYPGNTQPVTVEGLSKWVENYTLYFQRGGFQARVADDIRSSFLGRVFGISATRIEQTVAGEAWVSAQVSYSFSGGMLKGLTLIANGSNLTNQGMQTYQNNDPRQVVTWERYGRTYQVGFSYEFQ